MANVFKREELNLGISPYPMSLKCDPDGNVEWTLNNSDGLIRKDMVFKCGNFTGPFGANGAQKNLKNRMVELDNDIIFEQQRTDLNASGAAAVRVAAETTIDGKVNSNKSLLDASILEVAANKGIEEAHNATNVANQSETITNRTNDIAANMAARNANAAIMAASLDEHVVSNDAVAGQLFAAVAGNTTAINTEKDSRKNDVGVVASNAAEALNVEKLRAEAAEALVNTALNTEVASRVANDGVVASDAAEALNVEKLRAEAAEALVNTALNALDAFVKLSSAGSVQARLTSLETLDASHLALLTQIGVDWAAADSNLQNLLTGQFNVNSARLTYLEGVIEALIPPPPEEE